MLEEHNTEIKELEQRIVDLQIELNETCTFHTGNFLKGNETSMSIESREETVFAINSEGTEINEVVVTKRNNFSDDLLRFTEEILTDVILKVGEGYEALISEQMVKLLRE